MDKAVEVAQSAGVKNLEEVEVELRATETAIQEYEPMDIMRPQPSVVQGEGMVLREKQRLLAEARLWLKKAAIIQSLMEVRAETK
ncbi:MAG: hypothetical protein Q7R85_04375 [bacterium]|nr:hypothetical protein [bacterium]